MVTDRKVIISNVERQVEDDWKPKNIKPEVMPMYCI